MFETALITGASSGIGAALTRELVKRGTRVAIAARRIEMLEALRAELGDRVFPISADLLDPARAVAIVAEAAAALGPLDLVVANAGMGGNRRAAKLTPEAVLPIFQLNTVSAVATLTAALPAMVARKKGHLAGVTSLAASRGLPTSAAYSGSKAGLSIFLESLRVDLRGTGVSVTDIRPGFVDTPMTRTNRFPMPFLMDADRAAAGIAKALERKKPVHAFPFPTAMASRVAGVLPNWLYDLVARIAPV